MNRAETNREFWQENIGIRCPGCRSQKVGVIDSRPTRYGRRRRYRCNSCEARFMTREELYDPEEQEKTATKQPGWTCTSCGERSSHSHPSERCSVCGGRLEWSYG